MRYGPAPELTPDPFSHLRELENGLPRDPRSGWRPIETSMSRQFALLSAIAVEVSRLRDETDLLDKPTPKEKK